MFSFTAVPRELTAQMFSPNAVPHEIFFQIFSYLVKEDLAAVSIASRRFHAIAEPLYYKHVVLRSADDGNSATAFTCFLRSILSRPILGNYVRSLNIASGGVCIDFGRDPQNASDTALVTAAARDLGIQCSLTCHGGQLELLFHLLPSIQSLALSLPANTNGFDEFLVQQSFLPTAALPAGLKTLRDIWFHHNNVVSPKSLLVLLMLPSVRTIHVPDIGNMGDIGDTTACDGRSSVTQLTFGFASIPTLSLTRILGVPRALTHFTYIDRIRDPWRFDSALFGLALRRFHGTLQYLRLTLGNRSGYSPHDDLSMDALGSLRDWPVLRSVWCPMSVMLGRWPVLSTARLVDVLPVVISDLRVGNKVFDRWRYLQVMTQVMEVLEQKKVSGFENLEKITMMMRGRSRVAEEKMRVACAAVRVTLVFIDSTEE